MFQKEKSKRKKIILISITSFVILFSIASMIYVKTTYDAAFPRVDVPKYTGYLTYSDVKDKYDRVVVQFESGKNTLAGYIYGQENQKGLVVIAHGQGYGAENYLPETLYFADNGWRVFNFDCTGTNNSEGKSQVGIPQSVIDLDAALTYIESNETLNQLPTMLYGHSWGAYAVTAILNYKRKIAAVASVSGYSSPMELLFDSTKSMIGPIAYLEYPFEWTYQTLLFGSTSRINAVDGINSTDIPIMVIHGDKDEEIAYDGPSIIAHKEEITNSNVIVVKT